jgi:hypothetical protein
MQLEIEETLLNDVSTEEGGGQLELLQEQPPLLLPSPPSRAMELQSQERVASTEVSVSVSAAPVSSSKKRRSRSAEEPTPGCRAGAGAGAATEPSLMSFESPLKVQVVQAHPSCSLPLHSSLHLAAGGTGTDTACDYDPFAELTHTMVAEMAHEMEVEEGGELSCGGASGLPTLLPEDTSSVVSQPPEEHAQHEEEEEVTAEAVKETEEEGSAEERACQRYELRLEVAKWKYFWELASADAARVGADRQL